MELREQIKRSSPFTKELLRVPGWGVELEIRSLSLFEKTDLQETATKTNGDTDLKKLLPQIVIGTCFDPKTGEKIFSDEDMEFILSQPAGLIEEIAKVGISVSGLGENVLERGKDDSSVTPNTASVLS